MSIAVTPTYQDVETTLNGTFIREAKLAITGLSAATDNVVPHGLPATPRKVILVPSGLGLWGESSPADATNLHVQVGSSGATSGTAYVEY